MRKLIEWWRSWWAMRGVARARRLTSRALARMGRMVRALERRESRLRSARDRFVSIAEATMDDVEAAREAVREAQTAMKALQERDLIMNDIVLPSLVAHHKLLLERADADAKVQVRRGVGVNPPVEEYGE